MRRFWVIAVLAIILAGYWIWPYLGAYTLAAAAERGDSAIVAERVDFPALRRSLSRQIVRAYLRQSGRGDKIGALGRGLAMAVGTSVADPYLTQLLSPDAITALLGQGTIGNVTVENRTIVLDRPLPRLSGLFTGNLVHVVLNSHYDGIASFLFNIRGSDTEPAEYGIQCAPRRTHLALVGCRSAGRYT
jgi:hypothetical protein